MNGNINYLNTQQARDMLKVSTETLRRWDTEGKIQTIRTQGNRRLYALKDVQAILGQYPTPGSQQKIVYARVSFKKQENDLQRQINLLQSQFPDYSVVSDIGSGINWNRKGLQTILEHALKGNLSELVVAHRDRLCRFAFELLEHILILCRVKLVVLQNDTHESSEQELAQDILSIVHVYSCRNMGRRRYSKNPKEPRDQKQKIEIVSDSETTECV